MDILAHYVKGILFIIITEDKFITMEESRKYFAFISYQRQDEEWADWLQHQLEHYHLPANIVSDHPELPKDIRPLFRDKTELAGGILAKEIRSALENSRYLIVICSPNSAKSEWVDKEVQSFIDMGRTDKVIPFIIDGSPYSNERECFTPSLLKLRGSDSELLGINIAEAGREVASIKVVAQMLGLRFDALWQRYEREKAEEERKVREQRDNLLKVQSHFLAEKAFTLLKEGDSYTARLLALEALPGNMETLDRPYVTEAEHALRDASFRETAIIGDDITAVAFCPDGISYAFSVDGKIVIKETKSGGTIQTIKTKGAADAIAFSPDLSCLISGTKDTICVWNWPELSERYKIEIEKSPFFFDEIAMISVSPDNNYFAVVSDQTYIYSLKDGRLLQTFYGGRFAHFSSKMPWVVTGSQWGPPMAIIQVFNVITGKQICEIKKEASDVVFCPDGVSLTVCNKKEVQIMKLRVSAESEKKDKLLLLNNFLKQQYHDSVYEVYSTNTLIHGEDYLRRVYYTDDAIVVVGEYSGVVLFYHQDGVLLRRVSITKEPVKAFSFINKDNLLCLSYKNILYKSSMCDCIPTLQLKTFKNFYKYQSNIGSEKMENRKDHDRSVVSAHYNESGDEVIVKTKDSSITRLFSKIDNDEREKVYISRWNAATGKLIEETEHYELKPIEKKDTGLVFPLLDEKVEEAYSSGKKYKASAYKNCIFVKDVISDNLIMSFLACDGAIKYVEFNPNGTQLLTYTYGGIVSLWSFPPLQQLINETRERFKNRTLSQKEREQYYLEI